MINSSIETLKAPEYNTIYDASDIEEIIFISKNSNQSFAYLAKTVFNYIDNFDHVDRNSTKWCIHS